MLIDMRIRRAAGVIIGKYGRVNKDTGQPYTWTQAVALASYREPELTEDELLVASEYAEAALRFREIAAQAVGHVERYVDPETGRIRYRDAEGKEPLTVQDLIDAAGLGPFEHRRNG